MDEQLKNDLSAVTAQLQWAASEYHVDAMSHIVSALESAEKDRERLDWLSHKTDIQIWHNKANMVSLVPDGVVKHLFIGDTTRNAIDTAMQGGDTPCPTTRLAESEGSSAAPAGQLAGEPPSSPRPECAARKVIENAPHSADCNSLRQDDGKRYCTCWKSRVEVRRASHTPCPLESEVERLKAKLSKVAGCSAAIWKSAAELNAQEADEEEAKLNAEIERLRAELAAANAKLQKIREAL